LPPVVAWPRRQAPVDGAGAAVPVIFLLSPAAMFWALALVPQRRTTAAPALPMLPVVAALTPTGCRSLLYTIDAGSMCHDRTLALGYFDAIMACTSLAAGADIDVACDQRLPPPRKASRLRRTRRCASSIFICSAVRHAAARSLSCAPLCQAIG